MPRLAALAERPTADYALSMNLKMASTVALAAMFLMTVLLGFDLLGTFINIIRGYQGFLSIFRAGFYVVVSLCLTFYFFVSMRSHS